METIETNILICGLVISGGILIVTIPWFLEYMFSRPRLLMMLFSLSMIGGILTMGLLNTILFTLILISPAIPVLIINEIFIRQEITNKT